MTRFFSCLLSVVAIVSWNGTLETVGAKATPPVSVEYSLQKELGYFIGDTVRVSYRFTMPPDMYLREDSLPGKGSHGEWLDVRERSIKESAAANVRTYDLEIVYQLFSAAVNAQIYRIPPFEFSYGPREKTTAYVSRLPAVSVTISPLTSPGDSFKPHVLWSWTSSSSRFVRFAGAALMLTGGAFAAFLFSRRGRKRSHFKGALKRISREQDPAAALVIFRNVLNEKAGRAIFPGNLGDLLYVFPEAKVYEKELLSLVLLSEEMSFNPNSVMQSNGLLGRISETMKKLKRLETWA
ncbi:MAG: hypothetical protein CVU57_07320 [Deltaproteobacteria bacterium HGW-Deltaproteobacteria-15]|nr:MAG: hypothetical protein CVU57_07320 [Deltaproteobacteria bacterium HGW-Deltaproteobacteria-15]